MRTKTKCRAIKYWLKFCEPEHQNKLFGIAFTDQIGQDKNELWPSKLKRLLNLAGLGDIWSAKTNTPATMSYIRQRLLDTEQQTWIIIALKYIFVIVVNTCGCRRSVDNKAAILSYGKAPPKRDTFFSVQVYQRAGISQVEAYERVWEICHCGL